MKSTFLPRFSFLPGLALLLLAGVASAAEVRVMISAGFYGVYAELVPAFERASGHRVVTMRGPSMGDSPEAIPTRLTRGEAELGFQQVSELIHVRGVTFVGALPAELQPGFSFAGAITTKAQEPEAASALIRFLASPEATPVITKAGLAR